MTSSGSRAIVAATLFAFMTAGQAEPLVTDRPGQSTSTAIVGPGRIQVEMGYTHAEDDATDRVVTDSLPQALLRFGVVEDFELRLSWGGYEWQETTSAGLTTSRDGASDAAVGLKFRFLEEKGWRPETTLLAGLSLPVGGPGFTSERADPSIGLAFDNTLSHTLSLTYNLGASWTTTENAAGDLSQRNSLLYTVFLGIGLTGALGAFVELYGDIPTYSQGPGPSNSIDGGFTYLLSDDLQLDASAGVGLSQEADDWFVSLGLSFR